MHKPNKKSESVDVSHFALRSRDQLRGVECSIYNETDFAPTGRENPAALAQKRAKKDVWLSIWKNPEKNALTAKVFLK